MERNSYSNIALDRDRAFDRGYLEELLTQGKYIISEAVRISGKMEEAISNISATYDEINGEYKVAALGADLERLEGTLVKECYRETMDNMETVLAKLMENVPEFDNRLAKSMNELQAVLSAVSSRVTDLKSILDGGAADLSYEEYRGRLRELKEDWERSTEEIRILLAEIEGDMLGVTAAAIRYSKDPVNLSTGNFVYDHEDLKISGEIPLSFHRYYNAKDRTKGSLGRCFRHNYEMSIVSDKESRKVTVCMQDGQRKTFRKTEQSNYAGCGSTVEMLAEEFGKVNDGKAVNVFCMTMQNGYRYHFDEGGRLARQEDRKGRGITFSYNEEGKLVKAINDYGDFLSYDYDKTGLLIKVEDHTGRAVELSYEKKRLTAVKTPQGSNYYYVYGTNGRITETTNPRGILTVKNEYDDKYRIIRQDFPDGSCMKFTYEEGSRKVILTEQNGNRITYVHDTRYRNTDILYEDGTKEHFGYNEKNRRVLYTDRNGNTTRYAYDVRGNLTQIINALGQKINLTYDANNCLLNLKVNGKEKLHNNYDTNGRLLSSKGADGNGSVLSYDEMGRTVRIEGADGSLTEIFYDKKGNITAIRDSRGIETVYEYDALNRVSRATDGNGYTYAYEYDAAGRITKVTNPLGDSRSYCYSGSGKVTKVTDYDGNSIEASYNLLNKVEAITDKEGNVTRFAYDRMWNLSQVQQPDGGKREYIYDRNNRLIQEKLPEGGTVTYTYDGNGNLTSVTDAEGNITSLIYDALNRVVSVREADGASSVYSYDEEGNLIQATDALGNVTAYTYDEMGRRTGITDALGNRTVFIYDRAGNLEQVCCPDGTKEKNSYRSNFLSEVCRRDGSRVFYSYDGNGNLTDACNGRGEGMHYEYDALNRLTGLITPEGGRRSFYYDKAGNLICIVDENGNETRYEYSPNGNLTKVMDALGNTTFCSYDCMGHLVRTERIGDTQGDPAARERITTLYEWDLAGRVIQVTDPAGDVERYEYDRNGHMTGKWDKDGYYTAFTYGKTGRLTEIFYGDGRNVTFSYDALRRLEEVKDWNGVTKIVTDALGRTLSVTDPKGRTVSYEWGVMNEKRKLIYPNGQMALYHYNEKGQLETLTMGMNDAEKIQYAYDELGRLKEKQFSNGITTAYIYNSIGRLAGIRHTGPEFFEEYYYQYDAAGNKTAAKKRRSGMQSDSGSFGYVYDALNQLTTVIKDGKTVRKYRYDDFGNRIRKTEYTGSNVSGASYHETVYQYNVKNQLISEIDQLGEKTYSYDHRGNLTGVSAGGKQLKQFIFDAANHMSSSTETADGIMKQAAYFYNGLGRKVGQDTWSMMEVPGLTGLEQADNLAQIPRNPEQRLRYTLDITRQYHNLLGLEELERGNQQTFYWDGNAVGMEETGKGSFFLQDDLGSPMHLMDKHGRSLEAYGYDEFGVSTVPGKERLIQPFGYTGYQTEEAGGLYFAQERRYDAGLGRFISEDKVKGLVLSPITMNGYIYCWNRPMDLEDLNGKWPCLEVMGNHVNQAAGEMAFRWMGTDQYTRRQIKSTWKAARDEAVRTVVNHTVNTAADVINDAGITIPAVASSTTAMAISAPYRAKCAVENAMGDAADAAVDLWMDNLKWQQEFAMEHRIFTTTVCVAGVAAIAGVIDPGAAANIALQATVGGVSGGLANMSTMGSFENGFVGGAWNGTITAILSPILTPFSGNFFGGFVGNEITEHLNILDDPSKPKGERAIFWTSATVGLTQAGFAKYMNWITQMSEVGSSMGENLVSVFSEIISFMLIDNVYIFADYICSQIIFDSKEK